MITEQQILDNSNISDEEIKLYIEETQKEIDQYQKENKVLINRLAIYLNEGRILKRKEFVEDFQAILNYRNQNQLP